MKEELSRGKKENGRKTTERQKGRCRKGQEEERCGLSRSKRKGYGKGWRQEEGRAEAKRKVTRL